jgi:hypothetical protein
MHNTLVKGLMAQISEAGQMTPELETLFNEKILVTVGKRGRKPASSSSDTDSSTSSTKKPKRKYTRKTNGPNPHRVLVSKCIAFVYRTCDYKENPCNIEVLSVKRTNYQMVMGTCEFMATAMEKQSMEAKDAMIEAMKQSNEKWGVDVFDLEDAKERLEDVDTEAIPVIEITVTETVDTEEETPSTKKTPTKKTTPKKTKKTDTEDTPSTKKTPTKKTPPKKKEPEPEPEPEEEEVEEEEEEEEEEIVVKVTKVTKDEEEEEEEEEESDDEEEEEEEEDVVAVCLNN